MEKAISIGSPQCIGPPRVCRQIEKSLKLTKKFGRELVPHRLVFEHCDDGLKEPLVKPQGIILPKKQRNFIKEASKDYFKIAKDVCAFPLCPVCQVIHSGNLPFLGSWLHHLDFRGFSLRDFDWPLDLNIPRQKFKRELPTPSAGIQAGISGHGLLGLGSQAS